MQLLGECQDYIWERGRWREFDGVFEKAIQAATAVGQLDRAASFLAYRAGLRQAFGDWRGAVRFAQQSLRVSPAGAASERALFHLGAAAYDLGWYFRARKALEKARAATRNMRHGAQIEHKLSRVYRWYGDLARADRAFRNALGWAAGPPDGETDARQRRWLMAELLLDRVTVTAGTDPDVAMAMIAKSRQIYADEHFQRGLAYADLAQARLELGRGQPSAARQLIADARARLEEEQYAPGLSHVHFIVGMLERSTGRAAFPRALDAFDTSLRYATDARYERAALRAAGMALTTAWQSSSWGRITGVLGVLFRVGWRSSPRLLFARLRITLGPSVL